VLGDLRVPQADPVALYGVVAAAPQVHAVLPVGDDHVALACGRPADEVAAGSALHANPILPVDGRAHARAVRADDVALDGVALRTIAVEADACLAVVVQDVALPRVGPADRIAPAIHLDPVAGEILDLQPVDRVAV